MSIMTLVNTSTKPRARFFDFQTVKGPYRSMSVAGVPDAGFSGPVAPRLCVTCSTYHDSCDSIAFGTWPA
ncbi:unnamed protein product [Fusarium venenatum]|uniref:Uncharacterized protein n=1 Tax=Fusarium venenatum TaxID=56646 RepID=A0A2L2U326_9HYPO|nr:uncharacterized protein FVRRES_09082 [Fusarium venenatum]CEI69005.1 unnamed protein product [Fusarium venenatum]